MQESQKMIKWLLNNKYVYSQWICLVINPWLPPLVKVLISNINAIQLVMLKYLHLNNSSLFSYFRVNNRDYMQSLKSPWSVLHMSLQSFLFPVKGNSKGRRKNTQIYFLLIFVGFLCSDFTNTLEKVL